MTGIISFIAFSAFFILGWQFGLSPIKKSFETASQNVKQVEEKLFRLPGVHLSPDYISETQHNTDILHYELNLDLYPEKKILSGRAVLTGTFINDKPEKLDLNLYDNMKIKHLSVNGSEVSFIHKDTRLSIALPNDLPDTFKATIEYEGTPLRVGLSAFAFGEWNGRSVIYNLSELTYASTWFPCNDLPDDKAFLDMIITNDSQYTSVSNGVLIEEKIEGSRKSAHWKVYYPISTYLVSVYSSVYVNFKDYYYSDISKDTLTIEYYVFPEHLENAKKDFAEHPKFLKFFSETFGEYPFIKEKYGVAEFLWQFGAMEHQTITGIGSNFVSGRNFFKDVYVHELAHHWWGNAVGPKTWKDIWLNEGFSTYSEALYFEHKSGKNALISTMLSKYNDDFYGRLYDPGDNLFSQTIYDKGAWVLHMLRHEVGDSKFFKILRDYFEEFKYKSASTEDFINVCERVSGKDLSRFFDQWVFKGDDQIKLNVKWTIESVDEDKSIISINYQQTQERYKVFHFPLQIRFSDGKGNYEDAVIFIDEREDKKSVKLNFIPQSAEADPDRWLLADIKLLKIN